MPECKDCIFLRWEIALHADNEKLSRMYGDIIYPCNRYPMGAPESEEQEAQYQNEN